MYGIGPGVCPSDNGEGTWHNLTLFRQIQTESIGLDTLGRQSQSDSQLASKNAEG